MKYTKEKITANHRQPACRSYKMQRWILIQKIFWEKKLRIFGELLNYGYLHMLRCSFLQPWYWENKKWNNCNSTRQFFCFSISNYHSVHACTNVSNSLIFKVWKGLIRDRPSPSYFSWNSPFILRHFCQLWLGSHKKQVNNRP